MAERELDLLVIGGGITGAGIALDASVRGMRVGVVEKNDFGSGTSSRSTKLIHGGLRYLKQGEIKLVREVGRERALLYRNAPHLVTPAPMILPIYQGGTYGYFATSIGLYLYDLLAGVERNERRIMVDREEAVRMEPLLKREGLKGAGVYFEYRTDDARLTLDVVKTAVAQGAFAVNYVEAKEFLYRSGKIAGVKVLDRISGEEAELYAKHLVNAAGPWVDEVRRLDGPITGKRLFLTKGVHLVVAYDRLPVKQAAYFDTPDGRMVFVIPRGNVTYIGTTDTAYTSYIDHPRTTEKDRDYLLRAVNAMFPSVHIGKQDVLSHWAGLRPLIHEEGKGPSELSRKDEVFISPTGLISIAGGKLTGFRKMAEKVVDLVAEKLSAATGRSWPACSTDRIVISGGECGDFPSFEAWKTEMCRRGTALGVNPETAREWVDTYGTNAMRIFERLTAPVGSEQPLSAERLLEAQIDYAVEEEMTVSAADFLRLRTGWMYFHPQKAEELAETVLRLMGQKLGWRPAQLDQQRKRVASWFHDLKNLPESDEPSVGQPEKEHRGSTR